MRATGYIGGLAAIAMLLSSCARPFWRRDSKPRVPDFLLSENTRSRAGAQPQTAKGSNSDSQASPPAAGTAKPSAAASAQLPTPEQQRAARDLINATTGHDGLNVPEPEYLQNPADLPPSHTPLRNLIPVPPEEAASVRESSVPQPNSVERRGLRSPSLPQALPLDINGKATQSKSN